MQPPFDIPSRAFDLLDERVRRWVWQQKWNALRDAQEAAIPIILRGERDVLLSAATASGKTEAAFLPICSRLAQDYDAGDTRGGVRVLYLSPLKALINDQWGRLDYLCESLDIPVHRWHGDVGADRKAKLLKNPDGILLMTPESLEALFVRRGAPTVARLFAPLQYIVVDELHAFLDTERGRQLQSLLHRIDAIRAPSPAVPRIGLSATLSDLDAAANFLRTGAGENVVRIQSSTDGQEILAQIRGYCEPSKLSGAVLAADGEPDDEEAEDTEAEDEPSGDVAAQQIADHLFKTLRMGHHLVFANARQEVEAYTDRLNARAEQARMPSPFVPHHGSLSREIREDAEARLKDDGRATTAISTSTLEMGIDIGAMESIAQIGPPPTVAALRQRLGRSGRRGSPCKIRVYVTEAEIGPHTPLPDQLRLATVQSIAQMNLMLQGWCEPPSDDAPHFSTLVQQTLSVIAQNGGGASATALYNLLCAENAPFRSVPKAQFIAFLRALRQSDAVSQMDDGTLILGTVGERIVNHYSFYTAFVTPEEWRLLSMDGRSLGTLPVTFPVVADSYLIYAGKRWQVRDVDSDKRLLHVAPARGGAPPKFGGDASAVHSVVRDEMRRVYESADLPPFLDTPARDFLIEARQVFRDWNLGEQRIVACGPKETRVFLWASSQVTDTIALLLADYGIKATREDVCVSVAETPDALRRLFSAIADAPPPDGLALATQVPNLVLEKHDLLLNDDLRARQYAARHLAPGEAHRLIRLLSEF